MVTEYDQSGVRRTSADTGNGSLDNDVVAPLDPSLIMQIGMGFRPAKTLLSAVELDLFTLLGSGELTGPSIAERLGLRSRAVYDFLDGLVALRLLERDGQGDTGHYRNTPETGLFLDRNSPDYLGGRLEMANARSYGFWGGLTDALRSGRPQNESKDTGRPLFVELSRDPARLELFLRAMAGTSKANFHALAAKFDFSRYQTVCDVGVPRDSYRSSSPGATRTCNASPLTYRWWNRSPSAPSSRPISMIGSAQCLATSSPIHCPRLT